MVMRYIVAAGGCLSLLLPICDRGGLRAEERLLPYVLEQRTLEDLVWKVTSWEGGAVLSVEVPEQEVPLETEILSDVYIKCDELGVERAGFVVTGVDYVELGHFIASGGIPTLQLFLDGKLSPFFNPDLSYDDLTYAWIYYESHFSRFNLDAIASATSIELKSPGLDVTLPTARLSEAVQQFKAACERAEAFEPLRESSP